MVLQMVDGDIHKARTLASFLLDVLTSYETMPDSKVKHKTVNKMNEPIIFF